MADSFKYVNLKTPMFHILPKIHKENNPVLTGSPVINSINSYLPDLILCWPSSATSYRGNPLTYYLTLTFIIFLFHLIHCWSKWMLPHYTQIFCFSEKEIWLSPKMDYNYNYNNIPNIYTDTEKLCIQLKILLGKTLCYGNQLCPFIWIVLMAELEEKYIYPLI